MQSLNSRATVFFRDLTKGIVGAYEYCQNPTRMDENRPLTQKVSIAFHHILDSVDEECSHAVNNVCDVLRIGEAAEKWVHRRVDTLCDRYLPPAGALVSKTVYSNLLPTICLLGLYANGPLGILAYEVATLSSLRMCPQTDSAKTSMGLSALAIGVTKPFLGCPLSGLYHVGLGARLLCQAGFIDQVKKKAGLQ